MSDFDGVKIALLCGDRVLVYKRDDKPGLRFAGQWDLPGGGREGTETPEECIIRELEEECHFRLSPEQIVFNKTFPAMHDASLTACFMVATIDEQQFADMQFGEEGSKWQLMPTQEFINRPDGVQQLQERLAKFLDGTL